MGSMSEGHTKEPIEVDTTHSNRLTRGRLSPYPCTQVSECCPLTVNLSVIQIGTPNRKMYRPPKNKNPTTSPTLPNRINSAMPPYTKNAASAIFVPYFPSIIENMNEIAT